MPDVTYHLCPIESWLAQAGGAEYTPEGFEAEGFIHCTDGEPAMLATANRYYTKDQRTFCLLTIEIASLTARVIYEDAGKIYPHIYGRLNTNAVVAVRHFVRDQDGTFIGIGEPI